MNLVLKDELGNPVDTTKLLKVHIILARDVNTGVAFVATGMADERNADDFIKSNPLGEGYVLQKETIVVLDVDTDLVHDMTMSEGVNA